MKKTVQTIIFVIAALMLLTYPVMAQGVAPEEQGVTIFAVLTAAFVTISQSVGVGAALSFFNQLGKIWFPKYFPNDSSGNWRLGAILALTLIVTFVPMVFPDTAKYLTFLKLDQLGKDLAEFGALLIPLFIASTKYSSELFYRLTLRGTFLGKSYTLNGVRGINAL